MGRSRQNLNNFRAGVLSPNVMGLTNSEFYASGLKVGRNISIQTLGGMTRRAGSLFMRDYGEVEFVRIFPFQFNRDQKYIVVIILSDPTTAMMEIYKDNVLVAGGIVVPYASKKEIEELDFAQSADVMVFTQGENEVYYLRRMGDDADWDFIPVPIINPPQYNPTGEEPPVPVDMWSELLGYPKHCTFHQGRLWMAGSTTFPQNVWSSVSQDFFNFDLGDSEANMSIQEALDTDFINPITSIFSARKLQVFTRGDEFVNGADVMTPTTSNWQRQTNYGSEYNVPPVAVDGSTLFVDSSGRAVRSFTYADERGGYDAPDISSASEHLVKVPVRMGVLRGSSLEPANFVYVVNSDGTIALLNVSKAHDLLAWTEWTTQGFYRDIVTIDDEAYILVQRNKVSISEYVTNNGEVVTDNGESVWYGSKSAPDELGSNWMLERLSEAMLVDSGAIEESVSDTTLENVRSDELNFFGVYHDIDGDGKIVIVFDGNIVYQTDYDKNNPTDPYMNVDGIRYTTGVVFSYNDDVRAKYFDDEPIRQWYMYTLRITHTIDTGKNYIDGLTHLIGAEVVSTLDGNIQHPQVVVSGEGVDTVEKSYPDTINWRYDVDNQMVETFVDNVVTDITISYDGVDYVNPQFTEYGYLIGGVVGEPNSDYIEQGVVRESDNDNWLPSGNATSSINGYQTTGVYSRTDKLHFEFNIPENSDHREGAELAIAFEDGIEDGFSYAVIGDFAHEAGFRVTGNKITSHYTTPEGVPYAVVGEVTYDPDTGLFSGRSYSDTGFDVASDLYTSNGELFWRWNDAEASTGSVSVGWRTATTKGSARNIQKSEVRKMKLVASTTSEGLVTFPNQPFIKGQAGLFFPVIAETMPLNVSNGAGSLVNEPKRIVSVTTRYKDTQGVSVNGVDIPERQFGEEVLDTAPPLLTGIDKNRHLGYNRETSVVIVQNDPMPFTLLSIDIEVNY